MKIRQFTLTLVVAAVAVGVAPVYAQAPAAPKPGAVAAKPAPGADLQAGCIAEVRNARAGFERSLAAGIKGGRIDAKEQAMLKKTHMELIEMEKKAAADRNLSPEECKAIHAKIVEEQKQLQAAMAPPAGTGPAPAVKGPAPAVKGPAPAAIVPAPAVKGPAPVAARPAPGANPQAKCIAEVRRERAGFAKALDAGIKSGRIDAKEQAMLKKTHGELMEMEKKAAADHKMSPAECNAIHDKIVAEHKQLAAAMAAPPGKGPAPAAPKGK